MLCNTKPQPSAFVPADFVAKRCLELLRLLKTGNARRRKAAEDKARERWDACGQRWGRTLRHCMMGSWDDVRRGSIPFDYAWGDTEKLKALGRLAQLPNVTRVLVPADHAHLLTDLYLAQTKAWRAKQ